jgi:protocatechuate 3,4-dioxygenase alpha subunit
VSRPPTPSQTVGPFFSIALTWPDGPYVVPEGTPEAFRLSGRLLDGAGDPVPDALVETWQADPDGRFPHPEDPRAPPAGASAGSGAARPTPTGASGC